MDQGNFPKGKKLNRITSAIIASSLPLFAAMTAPALAQEAEEKAEDFENMKDDQKSNSNSILQLNIERERLKIKQEALYLDRNILKLAKKNIKKNAQQASPKGSIYVGRTND